MTETELMQQCLAHLHDAEHERNRLRDELREAQADAAALERGLRESVILLNYHAPDALYNMPSVTQPLLSHGGRNLAGAALLAELAAARKALEEIRGRTTAPHGRLLEQIFAEYDAARKELNDAN